MSNSAERETLRGRANLIPVRDLFGELYESKKTTLDRASEEALQRALASGNVEELLLHFDRMTREYRDL